MQVTTQHMLVLVVPVIIFCITFFIAEATAIKKKELKYYLWKPEKLIIEIAVIMGIGIALAVLSGFMSYSYLFK